MRKHSGFRNLVEYAAAATVIGTLRYSPQSIADRLGRFYAAVLDHAIPRLRRTGLRNVAMALPDADAGRVIDGVYATLGRLLVALARFPSIGRENVSKWIRYEGYEHFEAALARGRGVLFATAHLGNWELSAFAHALLSAPMHVVVRPLDNPLIDGLVEWRRTLSGNRLLQKKDYARGILKALAANEAVGILIDQNASLAEGVFVDFFGVPACAGTGFAKLAARTGAAVIPGFAVWSEAERRYILRFYPILEMTGDAEKDTACLHKMLESVIREYPDQWMWIHRRWKTRPPGEAPIY